MEKTDHTQYMKEVKVKIKNKIDLSKLGNVDFLKEGKFILCSKCLDNTPHIPAWGICQRCGTQYTTSLKA
jgi:predicted amidophosphoribosyltransferase